MEGVSLGSIPDNKEVAMEDQRELIFHDSIPLPEEELPKARMDAVKQKEVILNFFKWHPDQNFTPYEVFEQCSEAMMLLTSIRRSVTDLTKEGRLIKCDWSESKPGAYGKLNRTWRYQNNFINPLNSK